MKIVVIGSGLIGITSGYMLRSQGHDVTVIERASGPGKETSFANGALLTPSMPDPWNAPGCWRVLLMSLVRSDAALQLRLRAIPSLMSWGIDFLRNSERSAYERNTLKNLRLALYSREVMALLRQQLSLDFGHIARGTLRIFRSAAALDAAVHAARRFEYAGLSHRSLGTQEAVALEPALAPIAAELTGAVHYESDETGDAYRFCNALAEQARLAGVRFVFDTEISAIEVRSGGVAAVRSDRERFTADCYVVACGSYSTPLLEKLQIRLPVRPAKGYSVTFDEPSSLGLQIPVIDDEFHAAVVPLPGAIRVAGTAEFAGYDLKVRPERIRNLLRLLQQVLPRTELDPARGKPWCGLRPMSADGVPIIGATSVPNVFVNAGHGHLGWTMATGSGLMLADLISGRSPALEPSAYALTRFG